MQVKMFLFYNLKVYYAFIKAYFLINITFKILGDASENSYTVPKNNNSLISLVDDKSLKSILITKETKNIDANDGKYIT